MLNSSRHKVKARTVAGRGEYSLLGNPGSDLGLGRENEKERCEDKIWDERKKKQQQQRYLGIQISCVLSILETSVFGAADTSYPM